MLIQTIYIVLDILSVRDLDEWWPYECGHTSFPGITFFQVLNSDSILDTGYVVQVTATGLEATEPLGPGTNTQPFSQTGQTTVLRCECTVVSQVAVA